MIAVTAASDGAVLGGVCSTVDGVGPEAVFLLRDVSSGVSAIVVVDNLACGPAIGGVRMASDVTVVEIARLARAMTLKNALARLPHGGAKAGIVADPLLPAPATTADLTGRSVGVGFGRG